MDAIRAHLTGRAWLALAAAVALLCAASRVAPAAATGAASASRGARVGVDIDHFKFHPHTLRIGKGTTVVFSNSSHVAHTATRGGVFDTGRIKPGHSAAVRFAQKGTFPYHCKIHPFMRGKIVVG